MLDMELHYGIVPCVVQWRLLWFPVPTKLNRILGRDLKIKKYRIVRPFGGKRTPRSCLLTSVAKVLHRTHRKCGVNKEMDGWIKRGSLEPSSSHGDDDDDNERLITNS